MSVSTIPRARKYSHVERRESGLSLVRSTLSTTFRVMVAYRKMMQSSRSAKYRTRLWAPCSSSISFNSLPRRLRRPQNSRDTLQHTSMSRCPAPSNRCRRGRTLTSSSLCATHRRRVARFSTLDPQAITFPCARAGCELAFAKSMRIIPDISLTSRIGNTYQATYSLSGMAKYTL